MNTTTEPQLAPPGAGVPLPQRLAMRYLIKPLHAYRTPWEVSEARFGKVTAKIEALLAELTNDQLARRVLVPPMTGLEDSSRYRSAAMTVDHLAIVGRQMISLIRELDAGRVPPGEADTAKVKPTVRSVADSLRDFREFSSAEFPALLPSLRNRRSRTKFRHPWFGPMRAQGWFWLLATHQRLHLAQLEAIRRAL